MLFAEVCLLGGGYRRRTRFCCQVLKKTAKPTPIRSPLKCCSRTHTHTHTHAVMYDLAKPLILRLCASQLGAQGASCFQWRPGFGAEPVRSKKRSLEESQSLTSVAFCSPAKSLTSSGLMEKPTSLQKVKVLTSLGKMHRSDNYLA